MLIASESVTGAGTLSSLLVLGLYQYICPPFPSRTKLMYPM
jgi:hypothetical protein